MLAVLGARAAREAERSLALCGIDSREFAVLDYIVGAEAPISQATLAFRLGRDRSTVMRLTRSLSAKGLLVPMTDERDGRVRALQLTPDGRKVHLIAEENLLAAAEDYLSPISSEDVDAMLRTLVRIL